MQRFLFKQSLAVKPSKFLRESRFDFKFLNMPLFDLRNVNDFKHITTWEVLSVLMFIFGLYNT
ncbi:hypothetical protein Avbf_15250 [Armadillidium vulgare]|nr:hypothetical protein Avbf_15250 [Armadillidium vulgare]